MLFISINICLLAISLRLREDNVTTTQKIKINLNQLIVKSINNKILFN